MVTKVRGPLEQALATHVCSVEGLLGDGRNLDPSSIKIEPANRPVVGDFKFDLTAITGSQAPTRAYCQEVAARLIQLDGIEKAVGIPPRVYLKVSNNFLYEHTVPAILRSGLAYGSGDEGRGQQAIVTFSDPNANKPLHLGHLRNNFIGMGLAGLLEAQGYAVERHATLSDWGVHVCQAVLAYMKWGKGETPQSASTKGDRFVGHYYVMFHKENERLKQAAAAGNGQMSSEDMVTDLDIETGNLLRQMKAGDAKLRRLNQMLTRWAEEGISQTYKRIGTRLDATFGELETLEVAEQTIERALVSGACRQRPDGSVYVDLDDMDPGQVTLVRSDGTTIVYTQMMGIDIARFNRPFDKVLSIFGREWESGATGYVEVLRRLGCDWVDKYEPVFYGMVRLPEGRMKSREGKIVSADDLLDRICDQLMKGQREFQEPSSTESGRETCDVLAVGLLKYYFLRAKQTQDILYDGQTLWGKTLPAFAQIVGTVASVEAADGGVDVAHEMQATSSIQLGSEALRNLMLHLNAFPRALHRGLTQREPSEVVRFLEELGNRFTACRHYLEYSSDLAKATAVVLRRGLSVLNIQLPLSLELLPHPSAFAVPRVERQLRGSSTPVPTVDRDLLGR